MKQTIHLVAIAVFLLATLATASVARGADRRIVVLGDSIAAGYGVEASEAFPSVLQTFIEDDKFPFEVVNAGVSGETTAGGARRIDWLLKRRVDVLVIELGGNDGLRGIPPETTRRNLETIVTKARAKNPEIKIVLAGMQIFQNMGKGYVEQFQKNYEELAKKHDLAFVPFLLDGVGGIEEMNQDDQIHPNPQGHRKVAENVWAVLKPVLESLTQADDPSDS